MRMVILALALMAPAGVAWAGEVDVVAATAAKGAGGSYSFDVTLRHADEGWDHYADAWDVRAPDGTVLGTRVLYHPHVDEQPFTRSLSGVKIPAGVTEVTIHAHDKVHEHGGKTVTITLP